MDNGLAQLHSGRYDRQVVAAHHIMRSGQEAFAQRPAGMELCKILCLKMTHLDERTGQGIAHSQSGRSGGCRCQIQRARLMADLDHQMARGILGQQRIGISGNANQRNMMFQ